VASASHLNKDSSSTTYGGRTKGRRNGGTANALKKLHKQRLRIRLARKTDWYLVYTFKEEEIAEAVEEFPKGKRSSKRIGEGRGHVVPPRTRALISNYIPSSHERRRQEGGEQQEELRQGGSRTLRGTRKGENLLYMTLRTPWRGGVRLGRLLLIQPKGKREEERSFPATERTIGGEESDMQEKKIRFF